MNSKVTKTSSVPNTEEEKEHHSKCVRYMSDLLVNRSILVIIICIIFAIIMMILWQSVVEKGEGNASSPGQIFAIDKLPVKRFFALQRMLEKQDRTPVLPLSQTDDPFTLIVVVSHRDGANGNGNIWSKDVLQQIYETEEQIMGRYQSQFTYKRGFQPTDVNKWCQHSYNAINGTLVEPSIGCRHIYSPLRQVIFRNKPDFTYTDVQTLTDEYINEAVYNYSSSEFLSQGTDFFFAKDFKRGTSKTDVSKSWITRFQVFFGVPLNVTDNNGKRIFQYYAEDNDNDQQDIHENWVIQYRDFFYTPDPPSINTNYFELVLSFKEIEDLVQGDFVLAGLAAISVFFLIWFQTNSFLIGFSGILVVLMSYPISMTIYHGVFLIEIDTQLNLLALYVIIGIGADDVFVFFDAWVQSGMESATGPDDLHNRMLLAWPRAAEAMLVTSATTFVAFLMTSTSPIPAVSTFGIVAALMVVCMYALVITFFGSILVLYSRYGFDKRTCYCTKKINTTTTTTNNNNNNEVEMDEVPKPQNSHDNSREPSVSYRRPSVSHRTHVQEDVTEYRLTERFFYQKWAPFLLKSRIYILIIFVIIFIASCVGSALLTPPDVSQSGLPDDSELRLFVELSDEWFPPSQSLAFQPKNTIIWGLEPDDPIDRSGLDRNDEKNYGELNLLPNFKLDIALQNHIYSTCQDLSTATISSSDSRLIAKNGVVNCFMTDYRSWETDEGLSPTNDQLILTNRIRNFLDHTVNGKRIYAKYEPDIGGLVNNGKKITWVKISVDLQLSFQLSRSANDFWYDVWVRQLDKINNGAPSPAFMAANEWAVKATFDALVVATYISIFASFGVAVFILFITSRNYIVATIASFTILGIVLSVLGALVAFGKHLDFIESIVASLLVGLAVDYCVHLSNSYNGSLLIGRYYRAQGALLEMGVSVTSGMITTMTAAFFLLFTQLTFFNVFGQFILITIAFSYIWSTTFLMSALMTFGPNDVKTGNLVLLFQKLREKWNSKT